MLQNCSLFFVTGCSCACFWALLSFFEGFALLFPVKAFIDVNPLFMNSLKTRSDRVQKKSRLLGCESEEGFWTLRSDKSWTTLFNYLLCPMTIYSLLLVSILFYPHPTRYIFHFISKSCHQLIQVFGHDIHT